MRIGDNKFKMIENRCNQLIKIFQTTTPPSMIKILQMTIYLSRRKRTCLITSNPISKRAKRMSKMTSCHMRKMKKGNMGRRSLAFASFTSKVLIKFVLLKPIRRLLELTRKRSSFSLINSNKARLNL